MDKVTEALDKLSTTTLGLRKREKALLGRYRAASVRGWKNFERVLKSDSQHLLFVRHNALDLLIAYGTFASIWQAEPDMQHPRNALEAVEAIDEAHKNLSTSSRGLFRT